MLGGSQENLTTASLLGRKQCGQTHNTIQEPTGAGLHNDSQRSCTRPPNQPQGTRLAAPDAQLRRELDVSPQPPRNPNDGRKGQPPQWRARVRSRWLLNEGTNP